MNEQGGHTGAPLRSTPTPVYINGYRDRDAVCGHGLEVDRLPGLRVLGVYLARLVLALEGEALLGAEVVLRRLLRRLRAEQAAHRDARAGDRIRKADALAGLGEDLLWEGSDRAVDMHMYM
jgi:hypothetical protein